MEKPQLWQLMFVLAPLTLFVAGSDCRPAPNWRIQATHLTVVQPLESSKDEKVSLAVMAFTAKKGVLGGWDLNVRSELSRLAEFHPSAAPVTIDLPTSLGKFDVGRQRAAAQEDEPFRISGMVFIGIEDTDSAWDDRKRDTVRARIDGESAFLRDAIHALERSAPGYEALELALAHALLQGEFAEMHQLDIEAICREDYGAACTNVPKLVGISAFIHVGLTQPAFDEWWQQYFDENPCGAPQISVCPSEPAQVTLSLTGTPQNPSGRWDIDVSLSMDGTIDRSGQAWISTTPPQVSGEEPFLTEPLSWIANYPNGCTLYPVDVDDDNDLDLLCKFVHTEQLTIRAGWYWQENLGGTPLDFGDWRVFTAGFVPENVFCQSAQEVEIFGGYGEIICLSPDGIYTLVRGETPSWQRVNFGSWSWPWSLSEPVPEAPFAHGPLLFTSLDETPIPIEPEPSDIFPELMVFKNGVAWVSHTEDENPPSWSRLKRVVPWGPVRSETGAEIEIVKWSAFDITKLDDGFLSQLTALAVDSAGRSFVLKGELGGAIPTNEHFSNWQTATPLWEYGPILDPDSCQFLRVVDLNSDGTNDWLCMKSEGGGSVRAYATVAAPNFDYTYFPWDALSAATDTVDLSQCSDLLVVDLNGDGESELRCPRATNGGPNFRMDTLPLVLRWDDNAWGERMKRYSQKGFEANRCNDFAVGDFTGDGKDDIVCPYTLRGGGTQTFIRTLDSMEGQ